MTPLSTERLPPPPTDTPLPPRSGCQNLIPTARIGTVPLDLPLDAPDIVPVIGRYELGPLLGEGGMGAVYLATQTEPVRRPVAIKLIREGGADRDAIARFEAERQALALMDHPNVARIYDGGTTPDGRPYFVMEYVDGVPLTAYCDRQRLGVRERIGLFLAVCSAVQHAHQKGILHRDLKPGNILVETLDGLPVPKVIDFGLVKALHNAAVAKPDVTRVGQVMGTPAYMAPEQADVGRTDADTRADVYALGVILFELLTGSTPLEWPQLGEQSFSEQLRLVREADTPRPSDRIAELRTSPERIAARGCERARLRELVRGDLDWIVTRALEKERDLRYDSAAALADDLRRHLTHEPVSAGPPSRMYRARKFVRRNRGLVVGAGLVAATLVGGVIGTSVGMTRARAAEAEAKRDRDVARDAKRDEEAQRHVAEAATDAAKEGERKARESEAESRSVLAFFQDRVLTAARPTWYPGGLGTHATIRDALAAAEPTLATSFAGQPRAEGAIRDVLGKTHRTLGDYGKAIAYHERARDLLLGTLGLDHPETWSALNNLGVAWIESGRPAEALPLLERVVSARVGRLGKTHEETLDARNNLASAKKGSNRGDEALAEFERLESDCRDALGPRHARTLLAMSNRGATLQHLGRPDDALTVMHATVALQREVYGPKHPTTLQTVHNIGITHSSANRFERAVPFLSEALTGFTASMGPDHGTTVFCREMLAHALIRSNRKAEAAPYQSIVFRHYETTYGPGDRRTANEGLRSSACDLEAGRPAAARLTLETILAAWRDRPSPDVEAEYAGMIHGNLGDAHLALGQPALAAAHWLDAADLTQAFRPKDVAELAHCRARAGQCLLAARRVVPALTLLSDAVQACHDHRIPGNEPGRYMFHYGRACREYGDVKAAEHNMNNWVTIAKEGANRGIPEAIDELRSIAPEMVKLFVAAGKPDAAKTWRTLNLPREVAPAPAK